MLTGGATRAGMIFEWRSGGGESRPKANASLVKGTKTADQLILVSGTAEEVALGNTTVISRNYRFDISSYKLGQGSEGKGLGNWYR